MTSGRTFATLLACALLAACSGGGGGSAALPSPGGPAAGGTAPVFSAPGAGATPAAGATPPVSGTQAPTPPAAPGGGQVSGQSSSNYTQIVNGKPWPSNFRPYCANPTGNPGAPCPWNDALPDNPAQLYPNSSSIIQAMFGSAAPVFTGDFKPADDGGFPVYLAASTDRLVTLSCTQYCGVSSAAIHIPSNALGSPASDKNLSVIQPDGTEWDCWQSTYSGGATGSCAALYSTSILGSGTYFPGGGASNGNASAAGLLRFDEMSAGVIPHALQVTLPCVSGTVLYPGAQAFVCTSNAGNAPPEGARFQLTLTVAQINALNAAPWEKAILISMHTYGAYGMVTNNVNNGAPGPFWLGFEDITQYTAMGQPWPGTSFNFSSPGNGGGIGSVPANWHPGGINWPQSLRIVSACYAQETCSK